MFNRKVIGICMLCFILGFTLIGCDTTSADSSNTITPDKKEEALDKEQNTPEDSEIGKVEDNKGEEVKDEEVKDEEVKDEEIKDEEVKDEEIKDEEVKDEEIKDETDKDEEVKKEDKEIYEIDFRDLPRIRQMKVKVTVENDIIKLVNEFRLANGVGSLEIDSKLTETARYKSNAMTQLNYFAHENPNYDNKKPGYLLWDVFNIDDTYVAENIAMRESSADIGITGKEVFEMWANSPGHRNNMLNTELKKIGVGVISSSDKDGFYVYSTQHFSN